MICMMLFSTSRIDPNPSKPVKIYPLPHMYVVKDLVPVSKTELHDTSGSLVSTCMCSELCADTLLIVCVVGLCA